MPVLSLSDLRERLNAAKAKQAGVKAAPKAKLDPYAPENWHAVANAALINEQPCRCGASHAWPGGWFTLWEHKVAAITKLTAGRTPGLPYRRHVHQHTPSEFCQSCLSSKLSASTASSSESHG